MAYDEVLAQRLRDRFADDPAVRGKKMFGGLAFLTHGNMTVGVHSDELIVRLDPAEIPAALDRPGVRPFVVGGRGMKGWILVAGEMLDDPDLDGWLAQASDYVATLPPKDTSSK
ncbi:TfoX/Sxy family protein [Paractinoplanes ferrugineus]|uniref:RNA methyltransferase n=1 Tax=Paractinoplanes ferrugineus TaxID=113564 RepID=A0A919J2K7_9ACTN|nr:TfoX/Sxy family protein [Actinoplanes ferrugineus]GIE12232.1 RNA methyltransferase [Actinoplanes ferrugineus]